MEKNIYFYVDPKNPYEIKEVYFLDELITILFTGEAEFITDTQRKELKLPENYIDYLRKIISRYELRLPMYDIFSGAIYLIYHENIYTHLFYNNYRFTDKEFYDSLLQIKNPSDNEKENIRILSHYNLHVLKKTYVKIFYASFIFNEYITTCQRPSFKSGIEHIQPYYTTRELYYLAYDWNLIKKSTLSEKEIDHLCKKISQYDIPGQTLLEHQMYIYNNRAIGLVKYYSLFGSYYMNLYLRKYRCCLNGKTNCDVIKNNDLENQIKLMIGLIRYSPALHKPHTLYRFVVRDEYFQSLKIGDVYQEPGFISTTRNPFYYQKNYSFGYILIKINIPANIKGLLLSIEAYSNFPQEEEIILQPTSRFRLDNVTEESEKEKYQNVLDKQVKRRYEFTLLDNNYINNDHPIKLNMDNIYEPVDKKINLFDLVKDQIIKDIPISERLKFFRDNYVNMNNQFITKIGEYDYIFNLESYDSSSVYKPFFYYETNDGIMITCYNTKHGNINILLEIESEIHVNYYFKYSVTDSNELLKINRIEWIEWLSYLAYVVGSKQLIIHASYDINYRENDSNKEKQIRTRYTYSQDIYQYLKNKIKMFSKFPEIITANFDYSQLDYLFQLNVADYIFPTDKDELYKIYQLSNIKNMGDFYLYIVENYPKLIKILEDKMDLIYSIELNPFHHISYTLDAWTYLYNKSLINFIPLDKDFVVKKGQYKRIIGSCNITKFTNRLRAFLL